MLLFEFREAIINDSKITINDIYQGIKLFLLYINFLFIYKNINKNFKFLLEKTIMNVKEDPSKKHFYTYCISEKDYIRKSKATDLFLFYEFIEKTLNEFPNIKDENLDIIRLFLENIYLLISKPEENEKYLKYAVYLEEKAEELEKEGKNKINYFIDFSSIEDKEIKELNNLRINIRILEILFWNIVKNNQIPDNGLYLTIPHFLNVASKYIFYYIVNKYFDKLKPLERLNIEINYNEEKYKKYLENYKNKSLKEYI
ncbi:hypothetical protein YN1_7760 [Nanoarchaeota archaeon]